MCSVAMPKGEDRGSDSQGERLENNHEVQVLFAAEIAYSKGEIDKVYETASYLLNRHSGFYAVLSAGMLLARCAIWHGDLRSVQRRDEMLEKTSISMVLYIW